MLISAIFYFTLTSLLLFPFYYLITAEVRTKYISNSSFAKGKKKCVPIFFNVALAATLANLMSWVIDCAD